MNRFKTPCMLIAAVLNTLGSSINADECPTYARTIQLPNIKLEYGSTDTTLSVRMSSAREAFLAFAVGDSSGLMLGAEGVVGYDSNKVRKINLLAADVQIMPAERQTLINATFTQDDNGYSVLEFTKLLSDGDDKPIDGNGPNVFLWAQGVDNYFVDGHGTQRGRLDIELTPCESGGVKVAKRKNDKQLFAIHGIFAIVAYAILMPFAITAVGARKLITFDIADRKGWLVIHTALNGLANLLSISLFVLAVVATSEKGKDHFHNTHGVVGIITFILVLIQVILALFRPDAPHPPNTPEEGDENFKVNEEEGSGGEDNKMEVRPTKARVFWEVSHRLTAFAILGCALYQIHSGLDLYQFIYATKNYVTTFWIACAGLFVLLWATVFYAKW